MSDLRSKILNSDDLPEEKVYVDIWDTELLVIGLTAGAKNRLIEQSMDPDTREMDIGHLYGLLFVSCVYDPDTREQVFTVKDLAAIEQKSGAAVEKVAMVASRLSGIDEDENEDLGKSSSPGTPDSTLIEGSPSS